MQKIIEEKKKLEQRNKQLEDELRKFEIEIEEKRKMEAEKIAKQRNLEEEIGNFL